MQKSVAIPMHKARFCHRSLIRVRRMPIDAPISNRVLITHARDAPPKVNQTAPPVFQKRQGY